MTIDPALFRENERTAPRTDDRLHATIDGPIVLRHGTLPSLTIAYEDLGPRDAPVVWVCHALTGDAHATGWWSRVVGPGRAVDTNRFRVICANAIGGCQGTTGPSSSHPDDGRRWGSRFPRITIEDMALGHELLARHLGIGEIHAVVGGSMGGFQALAWPVLAPERILRVYATATAARHGAMQIGYNEVQRQAILRDPRWNGGDFDEPPVDGLATARMVGHLTFLSEDAFETKFGRRVQDDGTGRFEVESYLNYQGDKFAGRFDAGTMVTYLRAVDDWLLVSLENATAEFLFTSYSSDWLYPAADVEELHRMALAAGCRSRHETIDLPFGHDAFLLDGEHQTRLLGAFLESD